MTTRRRVTIVLALGLLSSSCGSSRAPSQEATGPATTAVEKHFASEAEAHASLDRYLDAAVDVIGLTDDGASHLACLHEYFCWSGGKDEEVVRADALCHKRLQRLDDAAVEAFGRYRSSWQGDVFGWVVYGDDGKRAGEEDKLARMHVIDDYTVGSFERFWAAHEGNPIAIAVIRGYSGQRWSSCCRDESTYFVWADGMESAFGKAIETQPSWRRLTVGCNGDRDTSLYRLGRGGVPPPDR